MRNKRPKKKRYVINKSQLAIGTRPKVKSDAYRKSFKDRQCEASINGNSRCTERETVVGAHIRTGECAGIGTKPSDDLIVALCYKHHQEQEDNPGEWWWFENCYKPYLRRRYLNWKQGN